MAKLTLIGEKDFVKGTEDPADVAVPVGATEVDIFIDRTDLTDSKIAVAVQAFLSLDGGLSWMPHGGFGTIGGASTMNTSGMVVRLHEPSNSNRKLRLTITLSDAARTALKYEFKV